MARDRITTNWQERESILVDLWYWLDYNDDVMTDEENNRIVFHTWEYDGSTIWN